MKRVVAARLATCKPHWERLINIRSIGNRTPLGSLAIAGFGLLLISSLWLYVAERGRSRLIETTDNEFSQNANLALALDVHTNQLLKNVDQFLLLIKDQYQGPGARAPIPLKRLVAPAFAGISSIAFVGVTNARGDVIESLQPFSPTNIADREFFQMHQRGEAKALLISEPVLGRVSGRWTITLTRRIDQPDSSFGGMVAISIEPRHLTELFETTTLNSGDVMSLVLTNGTTLARRRGDMLEFGENIAGSPSIAESARRPIGNFTGRGAVDGQRRLFSYRTMEDYPVIVTVGTLEADAFAPVRSRIRLTVITAALGTVFIGLVSAAGIVMLGRQQRANRRLREQASLLDKAQDAIVVSGLDRRVTYWNKSAERLYGWTADEARGRVVTELCYASGGADEVNTAYDAVMRAGEWTGELRPVHKSGRAATVESRFTLVRDRQGQPHSVLSINTDVSDAANWSGSSTAPSGWRVSAPWPVASPTISITCSRRS